MDMSLSRCERLRLALRVSQPQFAVLLGVSQQTVSRMENGQAEAGPVSILLDIIERDIAAGLDVTAPGYRIGFGASAENPAADFTGQGAGL